MRPQSNSRVRITNPSGYWCCWNWPECHALGERQTCFGDISLHFNSHFPGEPGLASVYWSKGWWRWWRQLDYGSYKSYKAPVKWSNHHHQQTNIQFFTGRMPFLSPNQQCQSTEGKLSHSMDLLTPSSPGGIPTLSLTSGDIIPHLFCCTIPEQKVSSTFYEFLSIHKDINVC